MFVDRSTAPDNATSVGGELQAPSELTELELENELVSLSSQINAATCRWLELAAEFESRRAHEAFGFAQCSTWLAWRCSLAPRAAREQLRVARRLRELPLIRSEFAAGRLSYSKVRALSRVADERMEADLVEMAHAATAAQLERLLRAYGTATKDAEELAAERRHLTAYWDADGMLSVRGCLPADEGALLLKALEIAREELFASYVADAAAEADQADGFARGGPPAQPNRADSLMALAETTIARGAQAASGGDRHQIVVHVDATPAASASGPGAGDGDEDAGADGGGPSRAGVGPAADGGSAEPPRGPALDIQRAAVDDVPLGPGTTRRLACDASVVTLVEADGVPLSVGRKTRSIPPAIRRALASRDRCCAYPGCEQERFVDAHHLVHWADGGETSLDNLVLLCRRHHRLVHEGGVTIEGEASAPRFRHRTGDLLDPAPLLPGLPDDAPVPLGDIASDPDPPWGRGERMDLDLAVFVLAARWEDRHGAGREARAGRAPPYPAD